METINVPIEVNCKLTVLYVLTVTNMATGETLRFNRPIQRSKNRSSGNMDANWALNSSCINL
jgi:hypothetical protein